MINNIKIKDLDVSQSSLCVTMKVSMNINNRTQYFIIKVDSNKPYLLIKPQNYVNFDILEKGLSKLRGFFKDKRNYKIFEDLISHYKNNNLAGNNTGLLLDYFDNLIKETMGLLEGSFKIKYLDFLTSLGYDSSDIMNTLKNCEEEKILRITNG